VDCALVGYKAVYETTVPRRDDLEYGSQQIYVLFVSENSLENFFSVYYRKYLLASNEISRNLAQQCQQ
jgi:hypothetical protein